MIAYFFFGPYDWLMIPGLLLGMYAQFKLMSTYGHYSRVSVSTGLSGAEAAREILDNAGLHNMPVQEVHGRLSDHYDPIKKRLCLSSENFHGRSIAAVGVAAHEAGHALQHKAAYAPLKMRMTLVPITGFASSACWLILLGGFFLSMMRVITPPVYGKFLGVAVGLFSLVTFFQLITLPVEFDASRRARERLLALGLIRGGETAGVGRVLNAAAMTYVAALVASALELLKLILMARHFNNRS